MGFLKCLCVFASLCVLRAKPDSVKGVSRKDAKVRKDAKMFTQMIAYFSSSFRPAFRLSKFKIALNTRK